MRKLLSAGIWHLFRSMIYRICMGFMILYAGVAILMNWLNGFLYPDSPAATVDSVLFADCVAIFIVSALFVSMFLGTEYSDGTIENKLTAGHSRGIIFLSNLITCLLGVLSMHVCYVLLTFLIGVPILGASEINITDIVKANLMIFLLIIVYTAIYASLSMVIQNKTVGVVVVLLFGFFSIFFSIYINQKLEEPEYYDKTLDYSYSDGMIVTTVSEPFFDEEGNTEQVKNPYYLRGKKRKVYEFLNDFLPYGQLIQILSLTESVADEYGEVVGERIVLPEHMGRFPIYAIILFTFFTAGGEVLFLKRDIRC